MRPDRKRIDSSGRTLLIGFAVVAAAFTISTVLAERSDIGIRHAAQLIAQNSAPSVGHLSLLRADLRQITLLADAQRDAAIEGQPRFDRKRMDAAMASLEGEWTRYRALPTFAGEEDLIPPAQAASDELARAVNRVDAMDQAGDGAGLRAALDADLGPAANRMDAAALRLIDFNAAHGGELGQVISRLGRQSVINAIVLDSLCLILTVATGFLAWRFVRRYTALLERRADELEVFAGRVAHDVVGPLSAASLALDLVARGGSPERVERAVGSGRAGIQRARLIADGLLAFARAGARPEAGAKADVAEVIGGAVQEIAGGATERGITLVSEMETPGAVACNAGVLASLVSNLLHNAVKYAGGVAAPRIVVRARVIDERIGRGRVRIEVEDNGPGLPVGLGDQAFEPYVRGPHSNQPGIGLGLATVKRIAEAHGGRVRARSTPGSGCTFTVELPAVQAEVSVPRPSRALASPTLNSSSSR